MEREISEDEESIEQETEKSQLLYETEEEYIIDEMDPQYQEHMAMLEAENADPMGSGDPMMMGSLGSVDP